MKSPAGLSMLCGRASRAYSHPPVFPLPHASATPGLAAIAWTVGTAAIETVASAAAIRHLAFCDIPFTSLRRAVAHSAPSLGRATHGGLLAA
jgi:hypothetical protein